MSRSPLIRKDYIALDQVARSFGQTIMSEPSKVNLKRRRGEEAPDILLFDSRSKRPSTNLHYVRQKTPHDADNNKREEEDIQQAYDDQSPNPRDKPAQTQREVTPEKRFYHLNRTTIGKKRKEKDEEFATFVEKRPRSAHTSPKDANDIPQFETPVVSPAEPLKRPSRQPAVKSSTRHDETQADRVQLQALVEYMHEITLEEMERDEGGGENRLPSTVQAPSQRLAASRLSGARSREIYQQPSTVSNGLQTDNEAEADDTDYVYDTYILSPTPHFLATSQTDSDTQQPKIGYLTIPPQDESLWETYLSDPAPSDQAYDREEEEDENAEDYYGADYPQDEVASDDEFDRDAYIYRRGGEEEWDEERGVESGDEDVYDRMLEEFRREGVITHS